MVVDYSTVCDVVCETLAIGRFWQGLAWQAELTATGAKFKNTAGCNTLAHRAMSDASIWNVVGNSVAAACKNYANFANNAPMLPLQTCVT